MRGGKHKLPATGLGAGILAASLLSLLTLSIFYRFQYYGPESALRIFNDAILGDDKQRLRSVTAEGVDDPNVQKLLLLTSEYLRNGARLRLDQMDLSVPRRATAYVTYVLPNRRQYGLIIVITKENRVWKINADQTSLANQRVIAPSPVVQ